MLCTHCRVKDGIQANFFVDAVFHDCLYNARDWVSFSLQLASILAWVVAQLPQFIQNYRNKSAEALSPWFLAEWFLGDSCNLVGCLLTGAQLPLTTGTAWYFIMCDVVMMIQFTLYSASRRRVEVVRTRAMRRYERARLERAASRTARLLLEDQDQLNAASSLLRLASHSAAADAREHHHRHIPRVHTTPQLDLVPDLSWQVHDVPGPTALGLRSHAKAGDEDGAAAAAQSNDGQRERMVFTSRRVEHAPLGGTSRSPRATFAQASVGLALCCFMAGALVIGSQQQAPLSLHSAARRELSGGFAGGGNAVGVRLADDQPSQLGPSALETRPARVLSFSPPSGKALRPLDAPADSAEALLLDSPVHSVRAATPGAHFGTLWGDDDAGRPDAGLPAEGASFAAHLAPCDPPRKGPQWAEWVGLGLGAISCMFYLKSRVSQIMKNMEGSIEGLSTSMFVCAMVGNTTGFGGIVLRLDSWQAAAWQLPWMLGMFGTVAMDAFIARQTLSVRRPPDPGDQQHESEPVLAEREPEVIVLDADSCRAPLLASHGPVSHPLRSPLAKRDSCNV